VVLVALLAAVALMLGAALLNLREQPMSMIPVDAHARPGAAALLREWDAGRASAWAAGDLTALRALYLPGSAAGRHDRAMLRGYLRRGLSVQGMSTQVLSLRVARHTPDRIVLVVTDRLVGATAVGGGQRVALPRDDPTTRRVTLRRSGGAWRVDEVRRIR
jgi:hypothetical protein